MGIPVFAWPWIWLGLTVVLIIIEGLTSGLTTIWFAAGSFLMIFGALLKFPVWLQAALFIVISLLLLIFTRPILKKKLSSKKIAMNSESIIGKKAEVIEEISEMKKGRVKINGIEWAAACRENQSLKVGDICEIRAIEGVTAIVVSREN